MAITFPTVAVGDPIAASTENLLPTALSLANTYTPTLANWSSASTAPNTTARYWLSGNICTVIIQSTLGGGTISVGTVTATVPFPIDSTGMIPGSTVIPGASTFDDVSVGSTAFFGGLVVFVDANTVRPMRMSTANPGVIAVLSPTTPFTWNNLDRFSMSFSYPVA